MSNKNPIHQNATQGFGSFNVRSPRNHRLSRTLLAASTFLAVSILPVSGAQASADATLLEVPRISFSQAPLEAVASGGNYTELAIIVKPDREPPRDGGDGDKPKRPPVEKRAVVSVHG